MISDDLQEFLDIAGFNGTNEDRKSVLEVLDYFISKAINENAEEKFKSLREELVALENPADGTSRCHHFNLVPEPK